MSHAGPVQELLAHLDQHYPIYSKSIRAGRARNQKSFDELGDFLLSAGLERLAVRVQAPLWQEDTMRRARTAVRSPA